MRIKSFQLACALLFGAMSSGLHAFEFEPWTEELYEYVAKKYGSRAEQHAHELNHLLLKVSHDNDAAKLQAVNKFFNQVRYVTDQEHWGESDYWQTPLQTLFEFEGDCEDIAIAKYTALRVLDFEEQHLNLAYVMSDQGPHMVMTYQAEGSHDPLVLDILTQKILPASQRKDLVPVYEFNSSHLWLADKKTFEHGAELPNNSLKLKEDLLNRIDNNLINLQAHNEGKALFPFALHTL